MAAEEKKTKAKTEKNAKEKPVKVAKEKTVKKEKPVKVAKEKKEAKKIDLPKPTDNDISNAFETIRFVLMTEKSVRVVESQNKLVFIARRDARRDEIKKAVESAFGSPVEKVSTMIDQSGRKKAFVKFRNAGAAGDIAIRLGVI